VASNIRLAIITPFFANLDGLTTASAEVVGLSTNMILSTSGIATGKPIQFDFDNLQLAFGDYYGAVFVNEDDSGNLTPVLVSAIHTDYVMADSGSQTYVPESNYDVNPPANLADYLDPNTAVDYNLSAANFFNVDQFGTFFWGFSFGGDANFRATFGEIPEPTSILLALSCVGFFTTFRKSRG
jgi:hypothetical protein